MSTCKLCGELTAVEEMQAAMRVFRLCLFARSAERERE
jgi:hypothetical protein